MDHLIELPAECVQEIIEQEQRTQNIISIKSRAKIQCCGKKCKRDGRDRFGQQRWRCKICDNVIKTPSPHCRILRVAGNHKLPDVKVLIVFRLLMEGMSGNAIKRVTGVTGNTIRRMMSFCGPIAAEFAASRVTGIRANDVEVDETWTYVFKKDFNRTELEKWNHEVGSAWIYVGLERASRTILSWHVGKRTVTDAHAFMEKLRVVTVGGFTIHTDGFQPYPSAVYAAFLADSLVALPETFDKPKLVVRNDGNAGPLHDGEEFQRKTTNHVERFNGTMRMHLARMSRATLAFSKSWVMLNHHVALFMCYYNFCLAHGGIEGRTPAMALGLTDYQWDMRELLVEIQKQHNATISEQGSKAATA